MIKKILKTMLQRIGYDIVRSQNIEQPRSIYCSYSQANSSVTDLEKLSIRGSIVPGMIDLRSGQNLYMLCYMQQLTGDVVEIGSWQGRSTIFLGNAVKDSSNGTMYAIDHFRGNLGKEDFYKVDGSLDDLAEKFLANVSAADLNDHVQLLDMSAEDAASRLAKTRIRFLFIDGDHTYEGVKRDIELFFPLLQKGAIVVFDDYFDGFPGLLKAVEESVIENKLYSKIFYYQHTLVIEIQK